MKCSILEAKGIHDDAREEALSWDRDPLMWVIGPISRCVASAQRSRGPATSIHRQRLRPERGDVSEVAGMIRGKDKQDLHCPPSPGRLLLLLYGRQEAKGEFALLGAFFKSHEAPTFWYSDRSSLKLGSELIPIGFSVMLQKSVELIFHVASFLTKA